MPLPHQRTAVQSSTDALLGALAVTNRLLTSALDALTLANAASQIIQGELAHIDDTLAEVRDLIGRSLGGPIVRLLIHSPLERPEIHDMDITAITQKDDEVLTFPLLGRDRFGNDEAVPPGAATVTSDGDGTIATPTMSADGQSLVSTPAGAGKEGTVNYALTIGAFPPHPLAVTIAAGAVAGIQIGTPTSTPLP